MGNVKSLFVVFLIVQLIAASCGNGRGSNKRRELKSLGLIDPTAEYKKDKPHLLKEGDKEFKSIDFFGINMQGKHEDIMDKIYSLSVLSIIDCRDTVMLQGNGDKWFSHTVEFCGVPWGMSANFSMISDDIMSIHDLKFITSKADDYVIDRVVAELTKYYGEPDIYDDKEDSYFWYEADNLCVRARHHSAPEGGWTFYFYIN